MTLVTSAGQALMKLVAKHDTFRTLHGTVSDVVEGVDLLMKDPRFRWYFRSKVTEASVCLSVCVCV